MTNFTVHWFTKKLRRSDSIWPSRKVLLVTRWSRFSNMHEEQEIRQNVHVLGGCGQSEIGRKQRGFFYVKIRIWLFVYVKEAKIRGDRSQGTIGTNVLKYTTNDFAQATIVEQVIWTVCSSKSLGIDTSIVNWQKNRKHTFWWRSTCGRNS